MNLLWVIHDIFNLIYFWRYNIMHKSYFHTFHFKQKNFKILGIQIILNSVLHNIFPRIFVSVFKIWHQSKDSISHFLEFHVTYYMHLYFPSDGFCGEKRNVWMWKTTNIFLGRERMQYILIFAWRKFWNNFFFSFRLR